MREVLSRHFEDLVFRRIKSMKGLSHTAASGLVGGFAGALMGATAFLAVNVLLPSTVEANPLGPGYYQRTNPLVPDTCRTPTRLVLGISSVRTLLVMDTSRTAIL